MTMRMTSTENMEKNVDRQCFSPLSAIDGGASGVEERRPATPWVPGEKPLRVFLTDDSRLVAERLITLLATVEGVQLVGSARTASAAIRGIHHLSPDLVILDFHLPDGTGADVLKAIKQDKLSPVVMMLTNFAYPQYRTECERWGADYFFDKSQEFERVVETCRHLLSLTAKKSEAVQA